MPSWPWAEGALITAAVLVILVYHMRLVGRVRRAPLTTAIGHNNSIRQEWVAMVMHERRDLLAVQTLRNWVMAASFLASTAIVICFGLLNLAFATEKVRAITQTLNWLGSAHNVSWVLNVLLLLGCFFFAFFNFSLAVRFLNHSTFMLTMPLVEDPAPLTAATATLHRGMLHYTLGMRGYYSALPCLLWFFGPTWMFCGAIGLVLLLARLDRSPIAPCGLMTH
jgi:uncharacterized membrane protein